MNALLVAITGELDSVEVPTDNPNSDLVFGSLIQRSKDRKTRIESFYAAKELLPKLQTLVGKSVRLIGNVYKNKKGNIAVRVEDVVAG